MRDSSKLTDFQLVDLVRGGEQAAYRHLVQRYEGKIYNLALRLLRRPEDAEDVLQETFLSAYRALPNFKGDSQFGTWLYRIATNFALMKLRGKKPVFVSLDEPRDDDQPPVELTDFSADPLADVLDSELRHKMEEAIAKLPEDMRTVFLLRDIEGLSNSEVAEILDLSVAAVKSRLHRTRLQLRRDLARYFSEREAARASRAPRTSKG
ncbi:MAG TPA: sigma-70 family RNA polymerase sigma factor [Candidatus Saccharimonadales bacterium]|nr:sigma-70 family RNA polymerase sigma factor [Candidatus Saccharimonadales bacterium]